MGFFAVIGARQGEALAEASDQTFLVEKLDVNIWCLPRFFGRFLIYCDIGLRIRAETRLTHFHVAIPFRTEQNDLSDLCPVLGDPVTAALVFGEPVISDDNSILDRTSDFALRRSISVSESELISELSSHTVSLWRVALEKSQPEGSTRYYRVRFRVTDFGRTWTWRKTFFRRVAALVDLHFCDPREAALVPHGSRYERDIAPLPRVNAFVIVPASLRMRKTSPELRYLRLLEGQRWERYLGRATDLRRRVKFLVHFWRPEREVSTSREFRAFLELGRNTEAIGWPAVAAIGASVGVVLILLDRGLHVASSPLADGLSSAAAALWDFVWSPIRGSLTVAGVVVLIAAFSESIFHTKSIRRKVRTALRAFESWVYRHRADLN